VRANLLYAHPLATDSDIERACQIANIWDFIQSLPEGTLVSLYDKNNNQKFKLNQRYCLYMREIEIRFRIKNLGLDTLVGERGFKLSGGEKQRIHPSPSLSFY
jgi:ABC-type multidrug transport system fused ATPase/permease subunit